MIYFFLKHYCQVNNFPFLYFISNAVYMILNKIEYNDKKLLILQKLSSRLFYITNSFTYVKLYNQVGAEGQNT